MEKVKLLFVEKLLVGIFASGGGILMLATSSLDKETLSSFMPAVVISLTGALITCVFLVDKYKKNITFTHHEKTKMNEFDSQVLSKIGWLSLLVILLPSLGIDLTYVGKYIQGILLILFGLSLISQFIAYYIIIKK